MAEWVVEFVLKNLADFIVKEAKFLGGVGEKVERVQRELIRIKYCLKDADSKKKGDERVQNWLNELRDVAYRIADATDTYFLPLEDLHQKEASSFSQKLKKVFKKPMKLPHLHKLGAELDKIQNLLHEIYESRDRYGIKDQPLEDKSKGEAVRMPRRRATYSDVDETQVVGMQAYKINILELLRSEQTPGRAVITIVGAGGLGKTTLACMVYKSAQGDFDYHIMLSISQQFSLTELLRKMIRKYNDSVPNDRDVDYYAGELKSFLSSKRYLIILDDVWNDDLWNELKDLLPNGDSMSRILITTRLIEVARSADSKGAPYELNFLNDRDSQELLLKKALPNQQPDKEYPVDLLELSGPLAKKCKGLPLALVVLGGILLIKEPSYHAWERVLQTMNWHVEGRDCMRILEMSYEDMPYYLKTCFQYLASFPEDYVISAKRLIKMWVAEGFIPLEGSPTIEIMAEDCLEELAKRSMVQVLRRFANGLIKQFQVHDILREMAMNEAWHENFVTVFSQASDDKKPNRIIRRASLHSQEKYPCFVEHVGPNTRSLLFFELNFNIGLDFTNFKLLKVLEIVPSSHHKLVLKSLDELIHLKYLGLRNCNINFSSCSFRRMKRLETMDMRGSLVYQLGDGFWSIGTLKHILLTHSPIPKAIDLSNLQTLKWVKVKEAFDWKLLNLRKLGIVYDSDQLASITNLLQNSPFLLSLGINTFYNRTIPMEFVYPKSLPNYQNLQSLNLSGKLPENVNIEASLLPPHLVKLTLKNTLLNHNPIPELGKLNSLKKLHLGYETLHYDLEGPIICQEGFPVIQYLTVSDQIIDYFMVAPGVMPKLTCLLKYEGLNVHLPPELQHVTVEEHAMANWNIGF